jgi:hypothetical protein
MGRSMLGRSAIIGQETNGFPFFFFPNEVHESPKARREGFGSIFRGAHAFMKHKIRYEIFEE